MMFARAGSLMLSSSRVASAAVSGLLAIPLLLTGSRGRRLPFLNLGLRLDDVQHLVFEQHADQHLALLLVAVLGAQLGHVLTALFRELFQAFFGLVVADLDRLFLGDLGHQE